MILNTITIWLVLASSVLAQDGVLPTSSDWVLPKTESTWVIPQARKEVIFFSAEWCVNCKVIKKEVLPVLIDAGWKVGTSEDSEIRIVDIDKSPELWKQYGSEADGLPQLVCVYDGEVIRALRSGCSTPQDEWGIGWLYKGRDERPEPKRELVTARTSHAYPLRGSWWSVNGDWRATRGEVINHLLTSPTHTLEKNENGDWVESRLMQHRAKIKRMSRAEAQSLHSDHHENRVDWVRLESERVTLLQKVQRKVQQQLCPT